MQEVSGSFDYAARKVRELLRSDGMKSGVPSWYVLEAQIFHPEEDTPCRPT